MNNRIFVSGGTASIEIYHKRTNRYFYMLVDAEDVEFIKENVIGFSVGIDRYTTYIKCKTKDAWISFHRFLLNTPKGLVVDHMNHNGLDNRKRNIRSVTYSINNRSYNKRVSPELNPSFLLVKEIERKRWESRNQGVYPY